MKISFAVAAFMLIVVTLAQTPPVLPLRFQQEFVVGTNESSIRYIGKLWYDS